jgi:hypothetical protein
MTISYRNTRRDVLNFVMYHYLRSPTMIVIALGLFWVVFTAVRPVLFDGKHSAMVACVAFLFMEGLALCFLVVVVVLTTFAEILSRGNKTALTEHAITVEDSGLIEETSFNRTEFKWSGIQKLGKNSDYIFIYISGASAHVVPTRAFANASERDEFYRYCKERLVA